MISHRIKNIRSPGGGGMPKNERYDEQGEGGGKKWGNLGERCF